MAGASSPLHNCCDLSSSSPSSRLLSVSQGRSSYQFLSLPSSSSSSSPSRRCHVSIVRASGSRGDRGPVGDTESKDVLNAFFLGKAVAESLTERMGTIVGELLSDIGRLQAEQQKQIRDFQEEVQERAQKAKIKAAQEAKNATTNISYNGSVNDDPNSPKLPSSSQQNSIQDQTDL